MASAASGGVVFAVAVMCMLVPSLATVYTIGDTGGWVMGSDYSSWTSDKTFKVGDSLVFNYGPGHTVDEVSESDYKSCTVGNQISSDSSGATTIALKTAGTHYFICGSMGHCGSGMKLAVTVSAASESTTTPAGSSSPGTPAASSGTTTTTTTPTTSNTPTVYRPASSSNSSPSATLASKFMAIVVSWVAIWVMVFNS